MTSPRTPSQDDRGQKSAPPRQDDDRLDPVEEAAQESFPASDPPSFTPEHAGSPEPDQK